MVEGRVLWLSDSDFIPELMRDESRPIQFRLKPEAFDASLTAHMVVWGDRVVKNRFGRAGEITSEYSGAPV